MDEDNFDLSELQEEVLSRMNKIYTVKEALEDKAKEDQEFNDAFSSLWKNYHDVQDFRKAAISNLKKYKYKLVLSNLLLLLIRNDFREEAKKIFEIINKATFTLEDESKLIREIYISLEKLQAHHVSYCNYELALLLSYIDEKNELIFSQVEGELIAAVSRMKGINTQNSKTYVKEIEEANNNIDKYALKLGLTK